MCTEFNIRFIIETYLKVLSNRIRLLLIICHRQTIFSVMQNRRAKHQLQILYGIYSSVVLGSNRKFQWFPTGAWKIGNWWGERKCVTVGYKGNVPSNSWAAKTIVNRRKKCEREIWDRVIAFGLSLITERLLSGLKRDLKRWTSDRGAKMQKYVIVQMRSLFYFKQVFFCHNLSNFFHYINVLFYESYLNLSLLVYYTLRHIFTLSLTINYYFTDARLLTFSTITWKLSIWILAIVVSTW